ncbi:MAG: cytochrome P450 [Steroidobacteraceae bacterium]
MPKCPFEMEYDAFANATQESLSNAAPVIRLRSTNPQLEGFLVTRLEDVRRIALDVNSFSSEGTTQGARFSEFNDQVAAIYRDKGWVPCPVLVWVDGPRHQKFRKIVDRVFTPKQVQARSAHIQLCIDKVLDSIARRDSIDGMRDVASKLPAMVMAREFGAPEEDYEFLMHTTQEFGSAIDFTRTPAAEVQAVLERAAHAATAFQQYMSPRIERVRREPDNTLLSELANAQHGGYHLLTMQELQSLLLTFLIAATHSTSGAIGWALYVLASRPDIQSRLRREPDKIEDFNEEVLRLYGTVLSSYRTATREVELHGVRIPKRASVLLNWASSNMDASAWNAPAAVDIDRLNPRGHVTFGHGPHFCVGNTLARREMLLTVKEFLARFEHIELDSNEPPPQVVPSTNVRLLMNLPLRLHAADSMSQSIQEGNA